MTSKTLHIPVLEREVLEALRASKGGEFLDCTLGGGGHTEAILESNPVNRVTASDRDGRAIERAARRLLRFEGRVELLHSDFAGLTVQLQGRSFDGLLADLGISSDQLREGRGFSFNDDASFDMRMDESAGPSAAELVNTAEERELVHILRRGGVGTEARQVARALVAGRPFHSARQCADVINRTLTGGKFARKKVNPATVVFQALRIAVNSEFEQIESLMDAAPELVKQGGRMAVITFHSLEDRAVMSKMREWESGGEYSVMNPSSKRGKRFGKVLTRKGIEPSAEEVERNPSARSARLRVFEFLSIDG